MSAPLIILDTGFGSGTQFLARWAAASAGGRPLHYLAVVPQLPAAPAHPQLQALWPLALPGWHRLLLDDGHVTLDLLVAPLASALAQIEARVEQFLLPAGVGAEAGGDAALARALARLAAPGAQLHAERPDEALVWALHAHGFIGRSVAPEAAQQAVPDLQADFSSRRAMAADHAAPPLVRRAVVIGAGVAGAAVCQRLCASGWEVTLIERHAEPGQEASGNRAGIYMPLLSKDDNIPTRLSRAAYLFALREWQRLGGVGQAFDGAACGVLQLARDGAHAQVQRAVVEGWRYPERYVRWLDAPAASAMLGASTPYGGWLFGQGGWARPASLCQAMLARCGARLTRRFHHSALALVRDGDEWRVNGADGALLAQAPTVILANGTGARSIAQSAALPLTALRGQVTHLSVGDAGSAVPQLPLVVCREAYVTPPTDGIVSAGATYDQDSDTALRASSQQENLARLADIVGDAGLAQRLAAAPLAGRVGFRCAAPDRLPLAGPLPDEAAAGRLEQLRDVPRHPGLYGLLGYASRGLIWAPLMAELLVAQLERRPLPLEASLAAALDPGRFLLKQRRRQQ